MDKRLWITYSWEDNRDGDIDYIAQELEKNGIVVKIDRWNIHAGKRLWEQIDKFISSEEESDAWAIIATTNSLGSAPCKEEIAYALDRALSSRGENFPIIGIFTSSVETELIPSAIKTRLFVSLKDDNWIERIKSTIENRNPYILKHVLDSYVFDIKKTTFGKNVIEIRPRAGSWSPFFCAIPISEKEKVDPHIRRNGKNNIPQGGATIGWEGNSLDNQWWIIYSNDEASPTMSYYFFCKELPSKMGFGALNSDNQITWERVK